MADPSRTSANNGPRRLPVKNSPSPIDGKTRLPVRANATPDEPKAASKIIRGAIKPADWDFKRLGVVFEKDVEEARKLKLENPAAFKKSVRAQEIVAKAEQASKWQIALGIAFAKSIPRPFRDLWLARDRTRKPKERLAAIERFARVFDKIPMNVGVALFKMLDGGPEGEVIEALGRPRVCLKRDPRTGEVAEADGRGRKRSPATQRRIETAARRLNEGISQKKMAVELYPRLDAEIAYGRTRDFFLKNRFAIDYVRRRLQIPLKPSRKAPR